MAWGGSALFSNDPNIGIRMMGKEAFIPTPLNSLTYKGRSQVDARRRQNYQNSARETPVREGAMSKKPKREQKASDQLALARQKVSEIFNPAMRSRALGAPPPMVAKPTIPAPKPSMARIADGLDSIENMGSGFQQPIMMGSPSDYRTQSGGIWWQGGDPNTMTPADRKKWEQRQRLRDNAGATDLPSSLFSTGSMIA